MKFVIKRVRKNLKKANKESNKEIGTTIVANPQVVVAIHAVNLPQTLVAFALASGLHPLKNSFIIDLGANIHIYNKRNRFKDFR